MAVASSKQEELQRRLAEYAASRPAAPATLDVEGRIAAFKAAQESNIDIPKPLLPRFESKAQAETNPHHFLTCRSTFERLAEYLNEQSTPVVVKIGAMVSQLTACIESRTSAYNLVRSQYPVGYVKTPKEDLDDREHAAIIAWVTNIRDYIESLRPIVGTIAMMEFYYMGDKNTRVDRHVMNLGITYKTGQIEWLRFDSLRPGPPSPVPVGGKRRKTRKSKNKKRKTRRNRKH